MKRALAICVLFAFLRPCGANDAAVPMVPAITHLHNAIALFGGDFAYEEFLEESDWITADARKGSLTHPYALMPKLLDGMDILGVRESGHALFLHGADEMEPHNFTRSFVRQIITTLIAYRLIDRLHNGSEDELRSYWELGMYFIDRAYLHADGGTEHFLGFLHGAAMNQSLPKPLLGAFMRDIKEYIDAADHSVFREPDDSLLFDRFRFRQLVYFEIISHIASGGGNIEEKLKNRLDAYFADERLEYELAAAPIGASGDFTLVIKFSHPFIFTIRYEDRELRISSYKRPPVREP